MEREWIDNDGAMMDLDPFEGQAIDVKWVGGGIELNCGPSNLLDWSWNGSESDIIAYRLAESQ